MIIKVGRVCLRNVLMVLVLLSTTSAALAEDDSKFGLSLRVFF
jgi:hypothetical protein